MGKLAFAMKVQVSFLSQVLKGKRNLSSEQGYFLARHLGFSDRESEYLKTLIQLDRAATPEYRAHLGKQLEEIKESPESREIPAKSLSLFYSSWVYSAVHLATGLPGHQTPEKIAERLNLDLQVVRNALSVLVHGDFCSTDGRNFSPLVKKTTVTDASPFMGRHKTNWRLKALDQFPHFRKDDLSFTGVVSIDRGSFEKIRASLQKAIREIHHSIEHADDEILVCLNLDWFEF